jgi:hypothetical protein
VTGLLLPLLLLLADGSDGRRGVVGALLLPAMLSKGWSPDAVFAASSSGPP